MVCEALSMRDSATGMRIFEAGVSMMLWWEFHSNSLDMLGHSSHAKRDKLARSFYL